MESYYQAPHAPLCLLRKNFQPPPDSIFACRDIWEMQREKTVANAPALQYWAEKTNLPTGGQPCLLAESVKELQEEMRCYLSFSDKEVFEGVTPLEEMSADLAEEAEPHSTITMLAIAPKEQATRKASQEPAMERKSPKFPRWEKVLHPSWSVVAVGQLPCPSRSLEQTHLLMANHNQHMKMAPIEAPSPAQELEVPQQWTPTPGFLEVTACLRGQLPEKVPKAPPGLLAMGMITAPGVATMSASCIIRDEVTGATYLDTVTTLIGRVTLSGLKSEIPAQGPKIEDVTDLV